MTQHHNHDVTTLRGETHDTSLDQVGIEPAGYYNVSLTTLPNPPTIIVCLKMRTARCAVHQISEYMLSRHIRIVLVRFIFN